MLRAVSMPETDVRARKSPTPAATRDDAAVPVDLFEPKPAAPPASPARVAELRFGQVGIAQLKLHSVDPALVYGEVDARVRAAPQLFDCAPVVFDLSALDTLPPATAIRALIESVHGAGLRPVGLAAGDDTVAALAKELDLPLFAKFRPEREAAPMPVPVAPTVVDIAPSESVATPEPVVIEVPVPAEARPVGQHHVDPVRSGQRLYARGTDLTVAAVVGHGAEVIADGSIHIYGVLRGRALAGARGDTAARIYCQNFQAELVAIAGQYRVFEEPVAELHGKPVQAWLEGDKLKLAPLS
jgi:septum site-determining protein MinC